MQFRHLALTLGLFATQGALAQQTAPLVMPIATEGLRMAFDVDGMPVNWQMDAAGTVQVDGLAYPGLILYVPATGVVYYQHPDEAEWLTVTPAMLEGYAYPTVLVEGAPWQPYLDAPTQRWEVKAAQMTCDNWFTSAKAGAVSGLTARDIWMVFNALQWLHAGNAAGVCERLEVAPAVAAKVGLPMYFSGPSGRWQLTQLGRVELPAIPLPTNPVPVDDAVRLRLLMHQFGPEERADILKEIGTLPVAQQLQRVQNLLTNGLGV